MRQTLLSLSDPETNAEKTVFIPFTGSDIIFRVSSEENWQTIIDSYNSSGGGDVSSPSESDGFSWSLPFGGGGQFDWSKLHLEQWLILACIAVIGYKVAKKRFSG